MGVSSTILHRYYHWIDLKRFKPLANIPKTLSVLFVGRMIPSKNALTLANLAKHFPKLKFNFIGTGPQYSKLQALQSKHKNIHLLGDVPYSQLHNYYQQASVLCLPSIYQEGWGRVLAESVACGTPVICSNLGGTVEAVSSEVAIIIKPTSTNFRLAIKGFFENKLIHTNMTKNCRPYALKHYSHKNISYITQYY
jgi:glycosyltransferase involved in cell wall biosynthesis